MSTSDKDATETGTDESSAESSPDAGERALASSAETRGAGPATGPHPRATAAGRLWVAVGVAVVVLVLLIIFIAENTRDVRISFLGASGKLSVGLAMLIAAVAGSVVTLLIGTTRILQLRHEVRRVRKAHRSV